MNFSENTKKILSVGVSLRKFEVRNWGLNKDAALDAIVKLKNNKIPILGGDVIYIENGKMDYTYDNWCSNRKTGESEEDFLDRSAQESMKYVGEYINTEFDNVFFVLIPDDKVSCDPVLDQLMHNWSK